MSEQTPLSFDDWLRHWGQQRLEERIALSTKCYKRMWDSRNDESSNRVSPVWELVLGPLWQESDTEWESRWRACGGELFDGRMMAPMWSPIWGRLAETFSDGFGLPYPPYAKYSCAHWQSVCDDEAIVLGVLSEEEFQERMRTISKPRGPLLDRNGKRINVRELLGDEYEKFVAYGNMTRQEKLEQKKEKQRTAAERSKQYRVERDSRIEKKRKEKDAAFTLLESVESKLKISSADKVKEDSTTLLASVYSLTETEHFEGYPKWWARAWKCAAVIHRHLKEDRQELAALRGALANDPKIRVKRRLKTLEQNQRS